jgi:hypothetical protein
VITKNNILYIVIITLIGIIFLQRCGSGGEQAPPKIDTVYQTIVIRDTVVGKPILVKVKQPTVKWRDSLVYVTDSNYNTLLTMYEQLGDKYYSEHIYKTKFSLGKYGSATVTDTIISNAIVANGIDYNIEIPEKTITIIKPADHKRQVYIGAGLLGNKEKPIAGGYIGGLYKDKKDNIFGANFGIVGDKLYYGVSSYWKIKF